MSAPDPRFLAMSDTGESESAVGSRSDARPDRALSPQFLARRWQPGESGNPAGHSGLYGEAMRLAREAAPDAIRRLIALMASADERVAVVACNAILDRAFGKPRVYEPSAESDPTGDDSGNARERNLALIADIRRRMAGDAARADGEGESGATDP